MSPRLQNTFVDQLLMKLLALNGVPLPVESYLNIIPGSSLSVVDNPDFEVDGEIVGSTDLTIPTTGGGGGSTSPPILFTANTTGGNSTSQIALNSYVWRVSILIGTSFDASANLAVGRASSHGLLISTFDLTQAPGLYTFPILVSWGTAGQVVGTVSGGPSVGSCQIFVENGPVAT